MPVATAARRGAPIDPLRSTHSTISRVALVVRTSGAQVGGFELGGRVVGVPDDEFAGTVDSAATGAFPSDGRGPHEKRPRSPVHTQPRGDLAVGGTLATPT